MKKLLVLISAMTLMVCISLCFSVSAQEDDWYLGSDHGCKEAIIDNVRYRLISDKNYGEHYVVVDFIHDESLAETTTKINIVDEIDGVEVLGIKTNYDDSPDLPSPAYTNKYTSVKKIVIPDNVKYIGFYAFNCFPSVEKLYLPEDLIGMGEGAFIGMESLKSITIPSGIRSINERAFEDCKSLTKVVLGEKVEYISEGAFCHCESLATINLPDSLKGIYDNAFSDTALTKVVIPEKARLMEGAFSNCKAIKKIVFENTGSAKDDYVSIDYNFRGSSAVEGVYIKTIPTKGILIEFSTLDTMPLLKDIYFAGSEELWEKLTLETERAELDERGITVHFYYRHSHSFKQSGNVTCTKGGTYTYTCECGDSYSHKVAKNTEGHKFGAWKVTRKPTYTVAGEKQRKCSLCGKVEKKDIEVLKLQTVFHIRSERTLDSITISWDPVEGANGYRVYWKDSPSGKYQKIASLKNKTTYAFKDLEKCNKYYFKIQPYHKDSKGNVAFANRSQVFGVFTIATAPANLKAVSTEPGTVKLTWESSGADSHYFVHYGTSKQEVIEDEEFLFIHVGKKESYTFKNLESGKTYYFKVHITDKTVDGVKVSNIAEVTVK